MRTALLVIDVQRDLAEGPYACFAVQEVIARINQVVARARQAAAPVIVIQHEDEYMVYDSPGWQLAPGLAVAADDARVRKTTPDSFHATELAALLQQQGVTDLVICGMQTDYCVNATTRRALELGYGVTLIHDGHTTMDSETQTAAQIIAQTNAALTDLDGTAAPLRLVAAADARFTA